MSGLRELISGASIVPALASRVAEGQGRGAPRAPARFRRRELLGLALAAAALPAAAQEARKLRRIGILINTTVERALPFLQPFRDELRRLGYVEGRDIVFEFAQAEGRRERYPDVAADIVRRNVDVIFVGGSEFAVAAKRATREIPVVVVGGDLVEQGLVASLARPDGNVTGIDTAGSNLIVKNLEWLKRIAPAFSRAATLGLRGHPLYLRSVAGAKSAAAKLGVSLEAFWIDRADEIESIFAEMARKRIQAVSVSAHPVFLPAAQMLAQAAMHHRIAAAFEDPSGSAAGGLLSYDPDIGNLMRRAAGYVDKILKGASPGDLPIEFATHFKLTINLKTAKALGLEIPETILNLADRVIE